jgi:hypothetical protein
VSTTTLNNTYYAHIDRTRVLYNTQQATMDELDELTGLDWIVNAEPVTTIGDHRPVLAYDTCENCDQRGTCILEDGSLLCPQHAKTRVQADLVDGANIEIGVLL